jgi:hypothetical protein
MSLTCSTTNENPSIQSTVHYRYKKGKKTRAKEGEKEKEVGRDQNYAPLTTELLCDYVTV